MKKHWNIHWIIICLIFILPTLVFAHGAKYSTLKGGVGITAAYLDDTPLADCDVRVFSPEDSITPYQTGQTDAYGRFMFLPDKKGKWKIIVDDGMGHRVDAVIDITADMKLEPASQASGGLAQWQKILVALCLIFGFTGLYLFYVSRKKQALPNGPPAEK